MAMKGLAQHARLLCPESDDHHIRVPTCAICKAIEQRLTPVTEVLADVLIDANLTVEFHREDIL
jgi:hypothetical protein